MLTLADAAGVALGFVLTLADADGVVLGFVLTLAVLTVLRLVLC